MKKKSIFIIAVFATFNIFAQTPTIQWEKSFGGTLADKAFSIVQTEDEGFAIVGSSKSTDGDVSGLHGTMEDFWIVKLTADGDTAWTKTLGGTGYEEPHSIIQTTDGGYIVAGQSNLSSGDVHGTHGSHDYWIVKLDAAGDTMWTKALGASDLDAAYDIKQTTDKGYIIAGKKPKSGTMDYDYWIVKLDSLGGTTWSKTYGGTHVEVPYSIAQIFGGNYIVAGLSYSDDGDVHDHHGSTTSSDYWIVKLDADGDTIWTKSLGGTGTDYAYSVQKATDNGYIIAGFSRSSNDDVTDHKGNADFWVVKLYSTGVIQWAKSYGGTQEDIARSVVQTTEGGYIIAGITWSDDGDVTDHRDTTDYWVVKTNSSGDITWTKSLGGSLDDQANSVIQAKDSSYVIAGFSNSTDIDITGNHGSYDYWIVNINEPVSINDMATETHNIKIFPNPAKNMLNVSNDNSKICRLKIFNADGRILSDKEINKYSVQVDISDFANGVYFTEIETDRNTVVNKKFVIVK